MEVRNSSDQVIKQQVWGAMYVDELVQTSLNDDPADGGESVCESAYWACQDANFNVLGVVDSTGVLVERYEYEPYDKRMTFISPGSNDTGVFAPILKTDPAPDWWALLTGA